MATAPTVPNFSQYNFELGDRSAVVTKQNGLNAALAQFGNSLAVMTDSINDDLTVMEQQKSDTQQAAQAGSESAQQAATDRQAVAEDRAHVDQQKQAIDTTAGQVSSHAQQVATDKQTVADNTATATQAAQDAGAAAGASIQAKNDAQALYGDLAAVDAAKSAAQQAATTANQGAQTATEKAQEASELLANAGTAYDKDAQENLADATAGRLALVGAFGGYGSLGVTEQDNPYPLNDVNTAPLTVPNGIYAASVADIANLPFPAGATFGAIEVKHIYGDDRVKLIAYSGGVVVGQGQLEGAGEKFERIYWASIGWVGPWVNVSDVVDRGVSPDFRDSSDPVAQLLAAGSFGGYGRVGGVGYLPAYPLRNINAVPWGTVAEGNYSVAYDDGSNSFETENLPFEVTTGALEGTVKVEVLTWGVVRLTAVYEGTDPALPVGTSYERYWVRYDSQGSNWAGPWKRLGGARYREVEGPADAPLMASGAHGVGSQGGVLNDFNNPPVRNEFRAGGGLGVIGDVIGNPQYWPLLDMYRGSSNRAIRLMFSSTDGPSVKGWTNGVLDFIEKLFTTRNIVGVVSQAAGMPTGAVIQSDFNSFGGWVKWADGTMWCFGHIAETVDISGTGFLLGGWRRSSTYTYDFPQTFVGANPVVELTPSYTTTGPDVYFNVIPCQFSSVGQLIRFGISYMGPAAVTGAQVRMAWIAKGRWY